MRAMALSPPFRVQAAILAPAAPAVSPAGLRAGGFVLALVQGNGAAAPVRETQAMTLSIRPANPARPDFVGEVSGIDLRQPLTPPSAAAIDAGMDGFAVLVFHDQPIDDDQQLAFSRAFRPAGAWPPATSSRAQDRRMAWT